MNALLWKKIRIITKNKHIFARAFLPPITLLLVLFFWGHSKEASVCYFPITTIWMSFFANQMDLENMLYKEYCMYTPMSLKKSWIINSLIIWLGGLLYSMLLLVLGYFVHWAVFGNFYIPVAFLLKGLINGISMFGFVLFSLQYEVDHAKWKQYSFYLSLMIMPILLLLFSDEVYILSTKLSFSMYSLLVGLALAIISLLINKKVSNEKYITSLDNIRSMTFSKFNLTD